jgi:hypothetical protein
MDSFFSLEIRKAIFKWLGHYHGNIKGICCPYRDCKCENDELCNTNPQCVYTTLEDMRHAKKIKLSNEKQGHYHFKQISRYDIVDALTDTSLPLSDDTHGPYRMTPPELLHASGSGIISYMFESLHAQIGGGKNRDDIDKLHIQLSLIIRCQSEHDYPRGAMHTVSLMVQSVRQKRGGGICFYYYALHRQKKDPRSYKRDCNTLPING